MSAQEFVRERQACCPHPVSSTERPIQATEDPLVWCLVAALAVISAVPAQVDWMRAHAMNQPFAAAMAYDTARERTVLVGGYDSTIGRLAETWEWDGAHWILRHPATRPAARFEHAMAYDAARQRVVLFGGRNPGFLGETWEWDGLDWVQRAPATSPQPRSCFGLAYDAARQRVVLFGGQVPGNGVTSRLTDTWEWDGTNWLQRSPAASPPGRFLHALAYDAGRQRIVLFGGSGLLAPLNDTWEWDGTVWLQRVPTTSPAPRISPQVAYDVARARVVLFGAIFGYGGSSMNDTWEWDGLGWRQLAVSGPPPEAHAMAYDSVRQRSVLLTGLGDTWEWDGSAWRQRSSDPNPPARFATAMAYDANRERVVLFGGSRYRDGFGAFADTWEWDGAGWLLRNPTSSPPASYGHATAYHAARRRVVMVGGTFLNPMVTWEWDGNTWLQLTPPVSPSGRAGHAMAYDAARQRVVLFGGSLVGTLADTWEWDGTAWLQRAPANNPPAREEHAMAYDAARQRVVLFGGHDAIRQPFGDTWEWDGTNWLQLSPLAGPQPRGGHAMAYHAGWQRIILFGGLVGTSGLRFADTWQWDGTAWLQLNPATRPFWRHGHTMAYDAAHQRVVLFGGFDAISVADTWLFGNLLPAQAQRIGSACAGTNGPPVITSGPPFLGNQGFVLDLLSARAVSTCLFGLGRSQNLSIGGGCSLYLGNPITWLPTATNAAGFSSFHLTIPFDPALRGGDVYTQAFVVDPLGGFAALSFSAALRLRLGD